MDKQCPNCGNNNVIIDGEEISTVQKFLFLVSFGVYNPWENGYKTSTRKFFLGKRDATCEVCGYRFNITEKIDRERIYENRKLSIEGEKRLADAREKDREKLSNYPKY